MLRKYVFAGLLCLMFRCTHGRSMMTTRILTLVDPLFNGFETQETKLLERHTDFSMGLTVVKDVVLGACFINSRDPQWLPRKDEKEYFTMNFPCEKVNENIDFETLKSTSGNTIASMCQDFYIFRVYVNDMPPPLLRLGETATTPRKTCEYHRSNPSKPQPDVGNNSGRNGEPPLNIFEPEPPLNTVNRAPEMKTGDPEPPMKNGDLEPPMKNGDLEPPMKTGDLEPPKKTDDLEPPLKTGDLEPPMKSGDLEPPLIVGNEGQVSTDRKEGFGLPPSPPNKDYDREPPLKDSYTGNLPHSVRIAQQKDSGGIPTPPPVGHWRELLARGITFSPPKPDLRSPPMPLALRQWLDRINCENSSAQNC